MITIFKKPKIYRFYKNEIGWFIDLKWFPFNKSYLAMIGGAEEFLDILSKKDSEIYLKVSSKKFNKISTSISENVINRSFLFKLKYGTFYQKLIKNKLQQIYLCPVTILIFGWYPKKIYYEIIQPLTFNELKVGMKIKHDGDNGIITECLDSHNIHVVFGNSSLGLFCLDKKCGKNNKIYKK